MWSRQGTLNWSRQEDGLLLRALANTCSRGSHEDDGMGIIHGREEGNAYGPAKIRKCFS